MEQKEKRIRPAARKDLGVIMKIYERARKFMAETGNPTQWKNGYPWLELLEEDISLNRLYVVEADEGVCGVFVFAPGPDPTYARIEGDGWRSTAPYGVIHRIASDGTHGVFSTALDFCLGHTGHIRIDTHRDNKVMQHVVEKHGFQPRGIIYVEDGTPRIAYDRIGGTAHGN